MGNNFQHDIKNKVKEYYGKVLKRSSDLKTNACCTPDVPDETSWRK